MGHVLILGPIHKGNSITKPRERLKKYCSTHELNRNRNLTVAIISERVRVSGLLVTAKAQHALGFGHGIDGICVFRLFVCDLAFLLCSDHDDPKGIYNLKWESSPQSGVKFQLPKQSFKIVLAVTVSCVPASLDNEECRRQFAESIGYTQIGEPLLDHITLKDIVETIPKKLYEVDDEKAWLALLLRWFLCVGPLLDFTIPPRYLLPLAWAFTGTAASGVAVVSILIFCRFLIAYDLMSF